MGEKNKKSSRKPAVARKSASRIIKYLRRKARERGLDTGASLKEFVTALAGKDAFKGEGDERGDMQLASDWQFNKRANFSNPNLCIGKTQKKKGGQKK